jgi:hypothetical protein
VIQQYIYTFKQVLLHTLYTAATARQSLLSCAKDFLHCAAAASAAAPNVRTNGGLPLSAAAIVRTGLNT